MILLKHFNNLIIIIMMMMMIIIIIIIINQASEQHKTGTHIYLRLYVNMNI